MTTFTIDTDNNITAFAAADQAEAVLAAGAQTFGSSEELTQLAVGWPRQVWPFWGVGSRQDEKEKELRSGGYPGVQSWLPRVPKWKSWLKCKSWPTKSTPEIPIGEACARLSRHSDLEMIKMKRINVA